MVSSFWYFVVGVVGEFGCWMFGITTWGFSCYFGIEFVLKILDVFCWFGTDLVRLYLDLNLVFLANQAISIYFFVAIDNNYISYSDAIIENCKCFFYANVYNNISATDGNFKSLHLFSDANANFRICCMLARLIVVSIITDAKKQYHHYYRCKQRIIRLLHRC